MEDPISHHHTPPHHGHIPGTDLGVRLSSATKSHDDEQPRLGDFSKLQAAFFGGTPQTITPARTPGPPLRTSRNEPELVKLGDFSQVFSSFFGAWPTPSPFRPTSPSHRDTGRDVDRARHHRSGNDYLRVTQSATNIADLLGQCLALDDTRTSSETEPEHDSELEPWTQSTPPTSATSGSDHERGSLCVTKSRAAAKPFLDRKSDIEYDYEWLNIDESDEETLEKLFSYQVGRNQPLVPVYGRCRSDSDKCASLDVGLIPLRGVDNAVTHAFPDIATNGIYVFLDMSNIHISFHKAVRTFHSIPEDTRLVPLPGLNLKALTELLARGRDVKVLHAGCSSHPNKPEPPYIEELRHLDWRIDLRARRRAEEANHGNTGSTSSSDEAAKGGFKRTPKRFTRHGGSAKNSPSSNRHCANYASYAHVYSSKSQSYSTPTKSQHVPTPLSPHVYHHHHQQQQQQQHVRYIEDLVDETLQTRIGESVMEHFEQPGTLVFATGDARPAKYSAGFQKYAQLALKMGWAVEVVSWRSSLSGAWRRPDWAVEWGSRFRVIELDGFLDDLVV